MSSIGIKVSKPGINVLTAAKKDLAFISSLRHMKILSKGYASSTTFKYTHGLGYRPAFTGYMKTSGRYFVNYFISPFDGYQFDNTLYGDIYTTTEVLAAEAGTAGRLVWICFVNPGDFGSQRTIPSKSNFGLKLSNDKNILTVFDSEVSLTSKFETPIILKTAIISVSVDAIGPTSGTEQKTNFTDYKHGLTTANHILVPEFYGAGLINLSTEPVGAVPPYVAEDRELSINEEVIRFRISRLAQGGFLGDASAPAKTVTLRFYLTNIKLP